MNLKNTAYLGFATVLFLSTITSHSFAQQGMGIGNNNPLEMLHVSGAIKVGTDINNSNAAPTGGAGTIRFKAGEFEGWDGTSWIPLGGGADTDWTVSGNDQYSAVSGNVGVGTTGPIAKLEVSGAENTTHGRAAAIRLTNTASGGESWHLRSGATGTETPAGGFSIANSGGYRMAITANGNVGFGTVAPEALLHVKNPNTGDATGIKLSQGAANSLFYHNADDDLVIRKAAQTDQLVLDNGGSIGIGTSSPDRLLNIESATGPQMLFTRNDGNTTDGELMGELLFDNNDDTAPSSVDAAVVIRANASGNQGNSNKGGSLSILTKNNVNGSANATERMRIAANGNVGVGTANPAQKLDVAGKIQMQTGATAGYIPVSDANGTMTWTNPTTITTAADGDGDATNEFQDLSSTISGTNRTINISDGTGTTISVADNDDDATNEYNTGVALSGTELQITDGGGTQTVDLNALVDDADWTVSGNDQYSAVSGNVGVGTTGPIAKLEVSGAENTTHGRAAAIRITNTATGGESWHLRVGATGTETPVGGFSVANSGGYRMAITTNGNVGFGTVDPEALLHVKNPNTGDANGIKLSQGAANSLFYHNTDDDLVIRKAAQTDQLVLDNDGNIGIGTSSPEDELHVDGSIRMVDGNQAVGYIPVSDANGTMTWTDPAGISLSVNEVLDADADTKIQVEESADEDVIRFDISGTETHRIEKLTNTNVPVFRVLSNSIYVGNNISPDAPAGSNVAIGANSATALTSASGNTFVGSGSGRFTTAATNNTYLGLRAGLNGNTASGNTTIGAYAGEDMLDGNYNVIIGMNAAYNKTGGENNVLVGYGSGENSGTGSGNVFLGRLSGRNETGSNKLYIENTNSATPLIYGEFDNDIVGINGSLGVGTQSPQDELHVEGSIRMVDGNESVGYIPVSDANGTMTWTDPAGMSLSVNEVLDADADTKIQVEESADEDVIRFDVAGTEQLRISTNGNGAPLFEVNAIGGNLYMGTQSGRFDTGGFNTFIGQYAGDGHGTGSHNTFIGSDAGTTHANGARNTFIGSRAGFTNTSGSGNVFIGADAGYSQTGSNKLYIENSTSSQPLVYGEFDNQVVGINGRLGVGTTNPTQGKLVVNGTGNSSSVSYGYLNSSGNTGSTGPYNIAYSIWATGRVRASEFNAMSDARAKTIVQRTNTAKMLELINKLTVTEYAYVDSIEHGANSKQGFIAQEIEAVYPNAVSSSTDYIPSIFSRSKEVNYDVNEQLATISVEKEHQLTTADKVKLILEDATVEAEVETVIDANTFTVKLEAAPKNVFVYGKQVDDFRAVDYDQVFSIGVAAIQELSEKVQTLESENAELKTENTALKAKQISSEERLQRIEEYLQIEFNAQK